MTRTTTDTLSALVVISLFALACFPNPVAGFIVVVSCAMLSTLVTRPDYE